MYISHKYKVPLALYIKIHIEKTNLFFILFLCNFYFSLAGYTWKEWKKNCLKKYKNYTKGFTEMHTFLSCLNNVHQKENKPHLLHVSLYLGIIY